MSGLTELELRILVIGALRVDAQHPPETFAAIDRLQRRGLVTTNELRSGTSYAYLTVHATEAGRCALAGGSNG